MPTTEERARKVALLVLDVDGVLTDGGLYFGSNGEALKRFHVRDGAGIKSVMSAGVEVAVITGRTASATTTRMAELGVRHVHQGVQDKLETLKRVVDSLKIDLGSVACVGDDLAELPLIRNVGLGVAVADAHQDLVAEAHWTTPNTGGHGAVRDVCDLIVAAKQR